MAVNNVNLYVSQILEDLDNGLSWFKRDDLGYGSIQEKYNAKDQQIAMIRKHPALKNAETTVTVFTVIDDTKKEEVVASVDNTPVKDTTPVTVSILVSSVPHSPIPQGPKPQPPNNSNCIDGAYPITVTWPVKPIAS
jgi:hypothetical protein